MTISPCILNTSALACIIVHYGDADVTRTCVDSLLVCPERPWIVVVCNGPPEEGNRLFHTIADSHPSLNIRNVTQGQDDDCDVLFLSQPTNMGFAAACNAGLRPALRNPSIRYAWLLNNDTTVAPNAPAVLRCCLEMHPRPLIGTNVFRTDTPERLELALGCRFSPWTTVTAPCAPNSLPNDIPESPDVHYIYGASLAFPLALVREIGMLDERFFLYYEEHDFCLRARQAGYTYYWCRSADVWHKGGSSAGRHEHRNSPARIFSHYHENLSTFLFLSKHYPQVLPFAVFFRTLAKLLLLPLRGECRLLSGYFRALFRACFSK